MKYDRNEIRRKTPEEYLRECQAEEEAAAAKDKEHLKILSRLCVGSGKIIQDVG